jgi:hypothetical protein
MSHQNTRSCYDHVVIAFINTIGPLLMGRLTIILLIFDCTRCTVRQAADSYTGRYLVVAKLGKY